MVMKKKIKLMLGDNMESLKKIRDNCVDSVVTDPPYGLKFMGKKWDYDVPSVEFWKEVYRVLKPGGHVLSFGGTRTYHRMVINIEDAGFEIRDQIMWLYGSGFPKSHNIGKAIDKIGKDNSEYKHLGTALKPANEPICLARKPLEKKHTIADNVLKHGTGGLNIDECRVGSETIKSPQHNTETFKSVRTSGEYKNTYNGEITEHEGRFPANIILDEEAGEILDEQSGESKSGKKGKRKSDGFNKSCYGEGVGVKKGDNNGEYGDKGGASRFFYCPKVSKNERNLGLDDFEDKASQLNSGGIGRKCSVKKRLDQHETNTPTQKNTHPTVKPVELMRYLCRLITPKGGLILDPYMGSGATGIAALLEGFRFCGMEMEQEYIDIAEARINAYEKYKKKKK